MMMNDPLTRLISFLRHQPTLARDQLLGLNWPMEATREQILTAHEVALDSRLAPLLTRNLLARLLLRDLSGEELSAWIAEQAEVRETLGDLTLENAIGGAWTVVPIPTVEESTRQVFWINWLAGYLEMEISENPSDWNRGSLDDEALEAVKAAIDAVTRMAIPWNSHGFVCWPLMPSGLTLTGNSMGLPLALGLFLIVKKLRWPHGLLATGTVREDGSILPVGYVKEKAHAAQALRSTALFLYPQGSENFSCTIPVEAVSSLKQATASAWMLAWGVQRPGEYHFYRSCMEDARRLLNNFKTLPEDFLHWLSGTDHLPEVQTLSRDIQDLKSVVEGLEAVKESAPRSQVYERFLSRELIGMLAEISPQHAYYSFRWCSAMVSVKNYQGEVIGAQDWWELAFRLQNAAPEREIARWINRCVISRHNRYEFRPNLPEDFQKHLSRRKEAYVVTREPDYILGSLYGTVAQNFAFCGPAYLWEVEEAVRNGQEAFGCWDLEQQGQKQWCYLAYARLDAGDPDGAWEALKNYLGIRDASHLVDKVLHPLCDGYALAAVARYAADAANEELQRLLWDRLHPLVQTPKSEHPWQLWCYNMGRIALRLNQLEEARFAWKMAVSLCDKGTPVIRPMTLLPLAALAANGGLGELLNTTEGILDDLRASLLFCRDHFRPIVNQLSRLKALDMVWNGPECFFPFMYR